MPDVVPTARWASKAGHPARPVSKIGASGKQSGLAGRQIRGLTATMGLRPFRTSQGRGYVMRLADFIEKNVEPILSAAEAVAATMLPAASHLDSAALRDHMPMIIAAVARDLRSTQTAEEQLAKSLGKQARPHGAPETAAQTHALLRAKAGFDIEQLVAEYRALRASVLRLWFEGGKADGPEIQVDLVRFNEAIDQAVAESVAYFHRFRNGSMAPCLPWGPWARSARSAQCNPAHGRNTLENDHRRSLEPTHGTADPERKAHEDAAGRSA